MVAELFKTVQARLQDANIGLRHIDLWNNQTEFEEEELPFMRPAAFMEILPFNPVRLLRGRYAAEIRFRIHLVSDALQEVSNLESDAIRELGLEHLQMVDFIISTLDNWSETETGVGSITWAGLDVDHMRSDISHHTLSFDVRMTSDVAVPGTTAVDIACRKNIIVAVPKKSEIVGLHSFDAWVAALNPIPLASPDINIITIGRFWKDLQPDVNTYDFNDLIVEIDRVLAANKRFTLKIATGDRAPQWLYDNGVTKLVINEFKRSNIANFELLSYDQPVFFESAYINYWKGFISALHAALVATPARLAACAGLAVTGINRNTAELRICRDNECRNNGAICSSDAPQMWADAGYTTAKAVDTFKNFYNHFRVTFPGKYLLVPMVPNTFPVYNGQPDVLFEILNWLADSHRSSAIVQYTFVTQNFNANALLEHAKSKRLKLAGQLAEQYFKVPDASIQDFNTAMRKFKNFGGLFVELFPNDVDAYAGSIRQWRDAFAL